jgi:NarL family two-component system response regulator LiaR
LCQDKASDKPGRQANPVAFGGYQVKSKTILLVDDHDALRKTLREWLEVLFPHHVVIEAARGEEAVTIAQRESPALIIMDIGLPDISGIEATRRIKASGQAAPIVVLTIQEDEVYRADAAEAGAAAYVPKRTMQEELFPALQALLSATDEGEGGGVRDERRE